MPKIPSVLFLLNAMQKQDLLRRHGYTIHEDDAESDLDFTLAEDIAAGAIPLAEVERVLDQ